MDVPIKKWMFRSRNGCADREIDEVGDDKRCDKAIAFALFLNFTPKTGVMNFCLPHPLLFSKADLKSSLQISQGWHGWNGKTGRPEVL